MKPFRPARKRYTRHQPIPTESHRQKMSAFRCQQRLIRDTDVELYWSSVQQTRRKAQADRFPRSLQRCAESDRREKGDVSLFERVNSEVVCKGPGVASYIVTLYCCNIPSTRILIICWRHNIIHGLCVGVNFVVISRSSRQRHGKASRSLLVPQKANLQIWLRRCFSCI